MRPWVTPADYAWPPRNLTAKDRTQPGARELARSRTDSVTTSTRPPLLSDSLLPGGVACLKQLAFRGVAFRVLEGSAGVDTPLIVKGPIGGITFWSHAGPMLVDCRFALALSQLAPRLTELGLVKVRFSGAYVYRTSKKGRLSLHAYGLAMDVHEVSTADQTYSVERDYARGVGERCGADSPILNRLACELRRTGIFRELLTPDYDADHRDHLHLGIAPLPSSPAVGQATLSGVQVEGTSKNRLGKRSAQVKPARQRRNDGAVPVASSTSGEGVASLRADLENLAQVTRDGLDGSSADQAGKLLPVEAEGSGLLGGRAPE